MRVKQRVSASTFAKRAKEYLGTVIPTDLHERP
jgi:hypothetical protein